MHLSSWRRHLQSSKFKLALRKAGVKGMLVEIVMALYEGAETDKNSRCHNRLV